MRLTSRSQSLESLLRVLSCLNLFRLISAGMNVTEELVLLTTKLVATDRRINTKTIEYFALSSNLAALQKKVGEYQDEDRRTMVQINGMPYVNPARLSDVVSSLSETLEVPIQDEDINLLQAMSRYSDDVFKKTGRKTYPILLQLKTRKIKWAWMNGLRNYLTLNRADYKANGLTVKLYYPNGQRQQFGGITLHEHLGPQKRILFKAVKKRCTEMDYQDMWFNDTLIFVKKRGWDQAKYIYNLQDMYKKITKMHWSRDNLLFRHNVKSPHNYDHDNIF